MFLLQNPEIFLFRDTESGPFLGNEKNQSNKLEIITQINFKLWGNGWAKVWLSNSIHTHHLKKGSGTHKELYRFVTIIICLYYHSVQLPLTLILNMKSQEIERKISLF